MQRVWAIRQLCVHHAVEMAGVILHHHLLPSPQLCVHHAVEMARLILHHHLLPSAVEMARVFLHNLLPSLARHPS